MLSILSPLSFSKSFQVLARTALGLFLGVLLVGYRCQAKTEAFVEPYVGLGKVELDFDESRAGTFRDIANGFFLGLKGGVYFSEKFFLGLDYHSAGPFTFDEDNGLGEWNHVMKGAGIGADYEVIRFWVGYYFDSEFEDENFNYKYKGTATKLGFGLLMNDKMRANLDFVFYDINEESIFATSYDAEGIGVVSTHVSVSIPLDF